MRSSCSGRRRRKGISIAPGPMFSARGEFRHCIRLNTGQVWSRKVEDAIVRIGRLVAAANATVGPRRRADPAPFRAELIAPVASLPVDSVGLARRSWYRR